MDLTGKQVLVVGGVSGIDKAIIQQVSELGARVTCYDENDMLKIESSFKEIVKNNGAFDGMVFCIVHSDFRPLQFVKPDYVVCITHTVGFVTMHGLHILNHIFFLLQCKFLAKIIGHTINTASR